jgi:exopolyphosphatase/guanosine-5'-triphosphate,3'-diphosphate pyrophosphatase
MSVSSLPPSVPEVVAVIDVGSTSVRCSVAQLENATWTLIEDLERPLELLRAIRGGRFSRANMDGVVTACADVLGAARSYDAGRVRAVASPSLRAVVNCDVLFDHIQRTLGLTIERIGGAEEGRLYHQALTWVASREGCELGGHALLMDLGSATSSVSLLREGRLVQSIEDHFATRRVAFNFRELRETDELLYCTDRLSRGAARAMLGRLGGLPLRDVFVTGREPRLLRRRLVSESKGLLPTVTQHDLDAAFEKLCNMTHADRLTWGGNDLSEFGTLATALCFMRHLCGETGVNRVFVPELQLRIGLLMDFLPGSLGPYRSPRRELAAAGLRLAERFGANRAYCMNVARLALSIYDALQRFHGLEARARELLEFAALVFDTGAFVNVRGRHKHTYYVVKSAETGGLGPDERELVAQVARYHRGRPPQPSHEEFGRLDSEQRARVSYLAAILRVAYALDPDRTQQVRHISCRVEGSSFLITVDAANVLLERWAMRRKSELFRDVFGLEVYVLPQT